MKYLLLLTLIFFSCKSSKKKYPPDSQMNIVASVTFPDGSKQLEIVVRLVKTLTLEQTYPAVEALTTVDQKELKAFIQKILDVKKEAALYELNVIGNEKRLND